MKKKMTILSCLLLLVQSVAAQDIVKVKADFEGHWYLGVRGGMPFGISTFSSFGADKTRAGWNGGLYGGFRFSPVLAVEASVALGRIGLSADEGCAGYWLGNDGNHYYVPVAGMQGEQYTDIYSSVGLQQYGIHLNVNLLGFFETTKNSRWSLNLSPAMYAVGTEASIKTVADKKTVLQSRNEWHFGIGADATAEYHITRNLSAGIYTGITQLTGTKMDGMPEHLHKHNFVWESGIRFGWTFGKSGRRTAKATLVVRAIPQEASPTVEAEVVANTDKVQVADKLETTIFPIKKNTQEATCYQFPTIYFAFNRSSVAETEMLKLREILNVLQLHPEIEITVTGWCDTAGSIDVNARISRQRAEAVKVWMVQQGIAPQRITTLGKGTDTHEKDEAKARRTDITYTKEKNE